MVCWAVICMQFTPYASRPGPERPDFGVITLWLIYYSELSSRSYDYFWDVYKLEYFVRYSQAWNQVYHSILIFNIFFTLCFRTPGSSGTPFRLLIPILHSCHNSRGHQQCVKGVANSFTDVPLPVCTTGQYSASDLGVIPGHFRPISDLRTSIVIDL